MLAELSDQWHEAVLAKSVTDGVRGTRDDRMELIARVGPRGHRRAALKPDHSLRFDRAILRRGDPEGVLGQRRARRGLRINCVGVFPATPELPTASVSTIVPATDAMLKNA